MLFTILSPTCLQMFCKSILVKGKIDPDDTFYKELSSMSGLKDKITIQGLT